MVLKPNITLDYLGDDYKEATSILTPFLEKKNTKRNFHYQADMNFKLGNFQKQSNLVRMAKS
jgi:hypothetical protein